MVSTATPSVEGPVIGDSAEAGRLECLWQRARLPLAIRELVLDDQRLRSELCWFAFDC